MPTYQYACRSCGHRFEVVQSMSEEPLTACPECGGELRKVYAPPAIAFRGSGFYATDHGKRTAKEKDAKGASPAKEGSDGGPSKDGGAGSGSDGPTGSGAKGKDGAGSSAGKGATTDAKP